MNIRLYLLPGFAALALLVLMSALSPVAAQNSDCTNGVQLAHAFPSGAVWSLCATVDDKHSLQVSDVYYRAPGDFERKVLHSAHLGQVLLHYHDKAMPEAQLNATEPSSDLARASMAIIMNEQNCSGELISTDPALPVTLVCERIRNNHILAKYAQRPSLQSQSWELVSAFERNSLTWTIGINFTEDGQIIPSVTLSGRASSSTTQERYAQLLNDGTQWITRATILSTWRLVFALDTNAADRVEQFEFPLVVEQGNRRPLHITAIETETLKKVHRENFRAWRVLDASGAGYYLDPSNSGFSYRNNSMNWAQFDIAVTRYRECEKHALFNLSTVVSGVNTHECGANLDEFVDGESLQDSMPVIWYSQTRTLRPSQEDWPVISNIQLSFNLMPFDWTSSSPFELITQ